MDHAYRTNVRPVRRRRQYTGLVVFAVLLVAGVGAGLAWGALSVGVSRPNAGEASGEASGGGPGSPSPVGLREVPLAGTPAPASTEPPQVAFDALAENALVSRSATVSASATGAALARLRVTLDATDGPVLGEATAAVSAGGSAAVAAGYGRTPAPERLVVSFVLEATDVSEGSHQLIASAITSGGAVSATRRSVRVDCSAPAATVTAVSPKAGLYVGRWPYRLTVSVKGSDAFSATLGYSACLQTLGGSTLRRMSAKGRSGATVTFTWDGKDANGKVMPAGGYRFAVVATDEARWTSAEARAQVRLLSLADVARRFSGAAAKEHALALARIGVRRAGSAREGKAADYVARQLASFGYKPRRARFRLANGAWSQNVVAVKSGLAAGAPIVIVGAHMDSIDNLGKHSPGGNDDASGVGVMLETARALRYVPMRHEMRFVAFGGEERIDRVADHHHAGSRALARALSAAERARGVKMVNLDMVGVGYEMGIGTQSGAAISFAKYHLDTARRIGYRPRWVGHGSGSDHEAFVRLGIPVAYYDWRPDRYYHSPRDTATRLQVTALSATGRTLTASLFRMAAR